MKRLIAGILLMSVSSLSLADCRLELKYHDVLANVNDFSLSSPQRLIKTLQRKGYQIRAAQLANDFEGAPNMILDSEVFNQQQGLTGSVIVTGANLKLLSDDGVILGEGSSHSVLKGSIGMAYYPNHVKKAMKKLPDCKEL